MGWPTRRKRSAHDIAQGAIRRVETTAATAHTEIHIQISWQALVLTALALLLATLFVRRARRRRKRVFLIGPGAGAAGSVLRETLAVASR